MTVQRSFLHDVVARYAKSYEICIGYDLMRSILKQLFLYFNPR